MRCDICGHEGPEAEFAPVQPDDVTVCEKCATVIEAAVAEAAA